MPAKFQGVGESRVFVDPAPPERDPLDGLRGCHIDGREVEKFAKSLWPTLKYQMTDEYAASLRVLHDAGVKGTRPDDFDKQLDDYSETLRDGRPMEFNHDPMRLAMDRHLPKGHAGLFMSDHKCATDGLRRGAVDYVPVLTPNGDKIKVGTMFLASAPQREVDSARRQDQEVARAMAGQVTDRVNDQMEQVLPAETMRKLHRRGHQDFEQGLQRDDIGAE